MQAEVLSSTLGSEEAQRVRTILFALRHSMPVGARFKTWQVQAADSKRICWRRADGQEVGDVSTMAHTPEEAKDQLWWVCAKDMVLTKLMKWDDVRICAPFSACEPADSDGEAAQGWQQGHE